MNQVLYISKAMYVILPFKKIFVWLLLDYKNNLFLAIFKQISNEAKDIVEEIYEERANYHFLLILDIFLAD